MSNTRATWKVELNCECPHCNRDVDLIEYEYFWCDNEGLKIPERDTPSSDNLAVTCPCCVKLFVVTCEY